jgi:hypothetical protein
MNPTYSLDCILVFNICSWSGLLFGVMVLGTSWFWVSTTKNLCHLECHSPGRLVTVPYRDTRIPDGSRESPACKSMPRHNTPMAHGFPEQCYPFSHREYYFNVTNASHFIYCLWLLETKPGNIATSQPPKQLKSRALPTFLYKR